MNTRLCLVGSWILIALPLTSQAQIGFQNGAFDSPGLTNGQPAVPLFPAGNNFITGWTTMTGYNGTYNGSVEYLADRSQDSGGYCVELGYYFGVNAIGQTFSTAPNQPYVVSFWLATDSYNGPPALLRVSAAGTSEDYQAPPGSGDQRAMGWQPQSFAFTSDNSGSTTLWFGNLVGIPAIDTVTVAAVPEPRIYALFLLGGLSIVLERRRHERPSRRESVWKCSELRTGHCAPVVRFCDAQEGENPLSRRR